MSRSAISSRLAKRASMNRGQSARAPVKMTNPTMVLSGTVSAITGNCGLSLPRRATVISTSKVAASTGAASSMEARKMPAAARHRGEQNAVEPCGDQHQQAHELEQVAQERCLDRGCRIEQVDQRKAELQTRDLSGKEQHLVQERKRETIHEADGEFA